MIPSPQRDAPSQDETVTCDVLVAGSGAGALATAITARSLGLSVILAEKAAVFGGNTAQSGGYLWIPCNSLAARLGVKDSHDQAYRYIQAEAGNHFDPECTRSYLHNGDKMVQFFTEKTWAKFISDPDYPDYHPEYPGGLPGGRWLHAERFNGSKLGRNLRHLNKPVRSITFLGMAIMKTELVHFLKTLRSTRSTLYVAKRLLRQAIDLIAYGRSTYLVNGRALTARLVRTVFDLGIPLWLSSPVETLIAENGAVKGAIVSREGRKLRVLASRGVVLACGGFPRDSARRASLDPHGTADSGTFSLAVPGNTGDGLQLAESAGGYVVEGFADTIYWVPMSRMTWPNGQVDLFPHTSRVDRFKPGFIAVMPDGRRFVNEACADFDMVHAMFRAAGSRSDAEAFIICDHRAIRRYGLGVAKPFPLPLFPYLNAEYLLKGDTIEELARAAGIDPGNLAATIKAFNAHAVKGEDPQFGKGMTTYDRFSGDPENKPNPCVAPLTAPPYFAVKIFPGDLGSHSGLKTDGNAQVLRPNGDVVPGLYAVGNDMANVVGNSAGSTLGPAMTFGYVAARHMAGIRWDTDSSQ